MMLTAFWFGKLLSHTLKLNNFWTSKVVCASILFYFIKFRFILLHFVLFFFFWPNIIAGRASKSSTLIRVYRERQRLGWQQQGTPLGAGLVF